MTEKQKAILFTVIVCAIGGVNGILLYGLANHFVLGHPSPQINWLLSVFCGEVLASGGLAWRRLLTTAEPSDHATPPPANPMVIEKSPAPEDEADPSVIQKEAGRRYLIEARNAALPRRYRDECARKALEMFSSIASDSAAYHSALYNIGTAHRELREYDEARKSYQRVKRLVQDSGPRYSEDERRLWLADVEMMLANVLVEEGKYDEAETRFLESWKLDPNNTVRMLNLHDHAVKMKKLHEARIWAELLASRLDFQDLSGQIGLVWPDGKPSHRAS